MPQGIPHSAPWLSDRLVRRKSVAVGGVTVLEPMPLPIRAGYELLVYQPLPCVPPCRNIEWPSLILPNRDHEDSGATLGEPEVCTLTNSDSHVVGGGVSMLVACETLKQAILVVAPSFVFKWLYAR